MHISTFGADIELFGVKSGKPISAIPLCDGTKHEPKDLGCGMFSHDNVALEFAIPVCENYNQAIVHINSCLKLSYQMLGDITSKPSMMFPNKLLKHPDAQEFGCEPDFNVYKMQENISQKPKNGLRSAGAHMHFGSKWLAEDPWRRVRFTKWLDATLGLVGVLADTSKEAKNRRKLYGKAGCIRVKTYGVEYRTLSSWWIWHPSIVKAAIEAADFALEQCKKENGENMRTPWLEYVEEQAQLSIQDTINNCIQEDAEKLIEEIHPELIDMADFAFDVGGKFKKNWGL